MTKKSTVIATSVISLALLGGVGVGIATADPTTSPTPSASPSASATPSGSATPSTKADKKAARKGQGQKGKRLVARALHGEVTLAGPKHRVVVFQRGTVTTVSTTSVTVKSKDGFSATYAVADTTKVRENKAAGTIGDIATDDTVRVVALRTGDTATARVIAEHQK